MRVAQLPWPYSVVMLQVSSCVFSSSILKTMHFFFFSQQLLGEIASTLLLFSDILFSLNRKRSLPIVANSSLNGSICFYLYTEMRGYFIATNIENMSTVFFFGPVLAAGCFIQVFEVQGILALVCKRCQLLKGWVNSEKRKEGKKLFKGRL